VRSFWLDRDRVRVVDAAPLGGGRYRVTVDDRVLEVAIEPLGDGRLRLSSGGEAATVEVTAVEGRRFVRLGSMDFVIERTAATRAGGSRAPESRLESPMPGVVSQVLVGPGDQVRKGQPLVAVEAMKMEHVIRAPRDGRVLDLRAKVGDLVAGGVPLVELDGAG
jgi:3-methylcrotonyl-CoA carboxylase alpha subunit